MDSVPVRWRRLVLFRDLLWGDRDGLFQAEDTPNALNDRSLIPPVSVTSQANVFLYFDDAPAEPAAPIASPVNSRQAAVAERAIRPTRPLPIEFIALPFGFVDDSCEAVDALDVCPSVSLTRNVGVRGSRRARRHDLRRPYRKLPETLNPGVRVAVTARRFQALD